jgi:ElaB/YqjD/DUF883 family membrane-anchored ribosome-binding protein
MNRIHMEKETQAISNDLTQLADDARALMAATADVAGDKVGEARQRLAAALERGKNLYGQARAKAAEGCKATDEAVHRHPYQAIAVGVGLGALVGYLVARRCSCPRE